MYIPTFGVKPNTSFLPAELLDADGFVRVDQYLRVTGTKDVYAVGDVSNMQAPQAFHVKAQTKYLAKSIVLGVAGKGGAVGAYKASASGEFCPSCYVLELKMCGMDLLMPLASCG
jgi:NADH dehydrogenase FAD-containing subunit